MRPRTIGRALGIGVRVAGRVAGQWLAARTRSRASAAQAQAQPRGAVAGPVVQVLASPQAVKHIATQARRGVSHGVGGFLRPFRRVGRVLWLEVTGAFFLLFAAVFALRLWQNWAGFGRSLVARDFAIATAAVFLYLGVSSFWRAWHR